MKKQFELQHLSDTELNNIIGLSYDSKVSYFTAMIKNYYPHTEIDSDKFFDILETYMSSFYLEKLYRSNRFFNEKFTPIYTKTGLIRNIIADLYFTEDDLITH